MTVMTSGAQGRLIPPVLRPQTSESRSLSFSIGFLDLRTLEVLLVGVAETCTGHVLCARWSGKGSQGIISCNPHRSDGKGAPVTSSRKTKAQKGQTTCPR